LVYRQKKPKTRPEKCFPVMQSRLSAGRKMKWFFVSAQAILNCLL